MLAPEVERIGPFGDRVAGRDRYLAMLEEAVPADYRNDVHLVTYAADGRAAFARVTEHLGYPNQTLHLEEAYAFGLDDEGSGQPDRGVLADAAGRPEPRVRR